MSDRSPGRFWLLKIFRSEAMLATILVAIGGVGFSLGSLMLARELSAREFGAVALFLAWSQIGLIAGSLGLEVAVIRHNLHAHRTLLGLVMLISVATGIITALAATLISNLDGPLAITVAATVVGASTTRVAVAFFQGAKRVIVAVFIMQINNYVLLALVPMVSHMRAPQSWYIAAIVAACYALTAIVAWSYASRLPTEAHKVATRTATLLREGLAIVGGSVAVSILFQLERLVIPRTMAIEALGTFAAIAAVAAAPFRMLQLGVGFTLMPRLQRCSQRSEALHLLRQEGLIAAALALLTGVAVLIAMPWIHQYFLRGRYDITTQITAVVIAIGLIRVWEALASSTVTALGTPRDLMLLNNLTWCAVALGAAMSTYGSRQGLIGVVLGAGLAWLAIAIAGSLLAARTLRNRSWDKPVPAV